ncbi:hypothetical protein MMC25_006991 [Agyrium rufum]|nr:hypothetical protein [Agyrium rufum]
MSPFKKRKLSHDSSYTGVSSDATLAQSAISPPSWYGTSRANDGIRPTSESSSTSKVLTNQANSPIKSWGVDPIGEASRRKGYGTAVGEIAMCCHTAESLDALTPQRDGRTSHKIWTENRPPKSSTTVKSPSPAPLGTGLPAYSMTARLENNVRPTAVLEHPTAMKAPDPVARMHIALQSPAAIGLKSVVTSQTPFLDTAAAPCPNFQSEHATDKKSRHEELESTRHGVLSQAFQQLDATAYHMSVRRTALLRMDEEARSRLEEQSGMLSARDNEIHKLKEELAAEHKARVALCKEISCMACIPDLRDVLAAKDQELLELREQLTSEQQRRETLQEDIIQGRCCSDRINFLQARLCVVEGRLTQTKEERELKQSQMRLQEKLAAFYKRQDVENGLKLPNVTGPDPTTITDSSPGLAESTRETELIIPPSADSVASIIGLPQTKNRQSTPNNSLPTPPRKEDFRRCLIPEPEPDSEISDLEDEISLFDPVPASTRDPSWLSNLKRPLSPWGRVEYVPSAWDASAFKAFDAAFGVPKHPIKCFDENRNLCYRDGTRDANGRLPRVGTKGLHRVGRY